MAWIASSGLGRRSGQPRSSRPQRCSTRELRSFLEASDVRLLPVTWRTADLFERTSAALRKRGWPIDAAHAMEAGAVLISFEPYFGLARTPNSLDKCTISHYIRRVNPEAHLLAPGVDWDLERAARL